jgi:diguanylate cyclase (GGDEF)-like protein
VRETDIIGRWGGDEFRVGLLELKDRRDTDIVAGRLLASLKDPVIVDGRTISITATIGVSLFPDHGQDSAALVVNADNAMYSAKTHGGKTRWHQLKELSGQISAG